MYKELLKEILRESKAGEEAKRKGLVHIGYGRYINKEGGRKIVAQIIGSKLLFLKNEEGKDKIDKSFYKLQNKFADLLEEYKKSPNNETSKQIKNTINQDKDLKLMSMIHNCGTGDGIKYSYKDKEALYEIFFNEKYGLDILSKGSIETMVNTLSFNWSDSSNSVSSLFLQKTIASALNIKNKFVYAPGKKRKELVENAQQIFKGTIIEQLLNKKIKDIYERSQKNLNKHKIKLYRGIQKKYTVKSIMESWTSDKDVAEGFDGKAILEKEIPKEQIFTFFKNNKFRLRHWEEKEYIIINRSKE